MHADNTELYSFSEKVLGAGFLEKVYQRALLRELGIRATAEAWFAITYKGQSIGAYFADLLVEDRNRGISAANARMIACGECRTA